MHKQNDSARFYYDKINDAHSKEIKYAKAVALSMISVYSKDVADNTFMENLLHLTKQAENDKSMFTYKLYDIIAHSYYNNRDLKKSLHYITLYFQNSPLSNTTGFQQYYYDILFLLFAELKDLKKMKFTHRKAKELALKIKDEEMLMRTYDFEARIYAMEHQFRKVWKATGKTIFLLKRIISFR